MYLRISGICRKYSYVHGIHRKARRELGCEPFVITALFNLDQKSSSGSKILVQKSSSAWLPHVVRNLLASSQMPQIPLPSWIQANSTIDRRRVTNSQPEAKAVERRRTFALRFRTIMCTNHAGRGGRCAFGRKCTFAHNDQELRAPELNEVEGITDDKAIRAFEAAERNRPRGIHLARPSLPSVNQDNSDRLAITAVVISELASNHEAHRYGRLTAYRRDPYSWIQPKKFLGH
jgi:hypothetical protein